MINYSQPELDFMDNYTNEIDNLPLRELIKLISEVFASDRLKRKMIYLIAYLRNGLDSFKLRIEDRGKSRSSSRSDRGDRIYRIHIEILDENGNFVSELNYLKGTLRPGLLEQLTARPLREVIDQVVVAPFNKEVFDHLMKTANWPTTTN